MTWSSSLYTRRYSFWSHDSTVCHCGTAPSALTLLAISLDTFCADGDPVPPPVDGNEGACVVDFGERFVVPGDVLPENSGRAVPSCLEHHVNPLGVRDGHQLWSCHVGVVLYNFSKAVSGARVRRLAYGTRRAVGLGLGRLMPTGGALGAGASVYSLESAGWHSASGPLSRQLIACVHVLGPWIHPLGNAW